MENAEDKIESLDSVGNLIMPSEKIVKINDVKGNHITIDDAKITLIQNYDLIQKVINGDKEAFNELYIQSYRYVFFIIRQYVPNDETTYDAIQETFIKVYKNICNLRDPAAYYSWLTSVAKNTAIDVLRTKPTEAALVYEEASQDFIQEEQQTKRDISLDIKAVLKEMNPDDVDLLSLVYYDGMRISQIAKMQGIPATTVYSRFNKAKKNLKARLRVHGIDKAIYSGNFITVITIAMRNIIGTAILSWSVAQQILDSIINGKGKKELAVARIIRSQQKKAILKIASVIVAISMITSAVTAFVFVDWNRFKLSGNKNNNTATATEYHYYNETEKDENSSQNKGGFWQGLFDGSSTDSKSSSDTNASDNVSYPSFQQSKPSSSSNSSQNTVYPNGYFPNSPPQESNTENIIPNDTTQDPNQYENVFGNNPNNVMRAISGGFELNGIVAKQGDWLYYVQSATRLVKVKTDGSEKQVIFESGFMGISSLNVIGDTIYYTNGGIWSIKTDGTDRKQISSKTAYNLLVRGTTGWFVEVATASDTPAMYVHYSLYQIDLLTGEVIAVVENGSGYGLKTLIDNSLIYVNGNNVYKRDLSTGTESVIKQFDFTKGIYNMCVNGNTIYFCGGSVDKRVIEIDINNPDVVKATYTLGSVYNYFDFKAGALYGFKDRICTFYSLQETALCEQNENIRIDVGIYTFDDGYAYYYDEDLSELYRCLPDGTDYKVY